MQNEPAGGAPLERQVRPAFYTNPHYLRVRQLGGSITAFDEADEVFRAPLYDQSALDAAVATERERWREWLTEKASNKRKCYTQTQDGDQLAAAEALDWAVRELAPNA